MGLIIQQKALRAAGGLRQILPIVRKRALLEREGPRGGHRAR
jgi:hypothetical protein